jgi:hypothetical protein
MIIRNVMGIDPGKTTGVFLATIAIPDEGEILLNNDARHMHLRRHEVHTEVEWRLQVWTDLVIACERFVITPETGKKTQQTDALEVIGSVRDVCERLGGHLVLQSKADAVRLAPPQLLRAIGWYKPGMEHANHAAAHALFALQGIEPRMFDILHRYASVDSEDEDTRS